MVGDRLFGFYVIKLIEHVETHFNYKVCTIQL